MSPIEEEKIKGQQKRRDTYEQYQKYAEEIDKVAKEESSEAEITGHLGSKKVKQIQSKDSVVSDLFRSQTQK